MGSKLEAWNAAQRFAAQWGDFMRAMETVRDMGSMEQAGDEAQRRLDKLRAEEKEIEAGIAEAKGIAENIVQDAERGAANVWAKADAERRGAEERAKEMMAEAEKMAHHTREYIIPTMTLNAKEKAQKIEQDMHNGLRVARQQLEEMEGRIAELDTAIADKSALLVNIQGQIAALQAKFGG